MKLLMHYMFISWICGSNSANRTVHGMRIRKWWHSVRWYSHLIISRSVFKSSRYLKNGTCPYLSLYTIRREWLVSLPWVAIRWGGYSSAGAHFETKIASSRNRIFKYFKNYYFCTFELNISGDHPSNDILEWM